MLNNFSPVRKVIHLIQLKVAVNQLIIDSIFTILPGRLTTFVLSKEKHDMEMKIIGNKIAGARKKLKFSQAELSRHLFISPQAVSKWERGESIPDIIMFNRLSKVLQVDLNYFSDDFQKLDLISMEDGNGSEKTANKSPDLEKLINFNGSNLSESDFSGVHAHRRKFNGSALRCSNFSCADLSGSLFKGSDVSESNFDSANLTECIFSGVNLNDASFQKSILKRTEFSKLSLTQATFTDVELIDVKLIRIDLRNTIFQNCIFNNVVFNHCDMQKLSFDSQTFINISFGKNDLNQVSFKDATLKNVSFRPSYTLTNKYYRALKTICFQGARMDKLTHLGLKGLGANLNKVVIIP